MSDTLNTSMQSQLIAIGELAEGLDVLEEIQKLPLNKNLRPYVNI